MKKILVLLLLFVALLFGSGLVSRTLADDHHTGGRHDDHHDRDDHDDHDHTGDCDHDGDPTDPTEATECATPTPTPTPINTGDCDHDGDPTDPTEATECATPTPTPIPTPTPTVVPTSTPVPTATPNPSSGSQSQMGIDGTICAHTNFGAWMIVKQDGNPIAGVNVKFVYNNEAKFVKTETNGRAGVDYGYAQDGDVQAIPDSGFPSQTQHISKAVDAACAHVSTTTTPTGSVLGVSTMAGTGIIEDTLVNMVGLMGVVFTTAGSFLYVKKNR